jgi:hypothetical protein
MHSAASRKVLAVNCTAMAGDDPGDDSDLRLSYTFSLIAVLEIL